MDGSLLLAGGGNDPNLKCLEAAAAAAGVRTQTLYRTAGEEPAVLWSADSNRLIVNGEEITSKAIFIRHDVFSYLSSGSQNDSNLAQSWYGLAIGWCLSNPEVACFNRRFDFRSSSKMSVLSFAHQIGIAIPPTRVTNDRAEVESAINSGFGTVAKPIAGGGYCKELQDLRAEVEWRNNRAPAPAFIQPKLTYPEYR
ncbi:MAG: hypothetical protein AAF387_17730, partial [Pseudomonadota bacterium]